MIMQEKNKSYEKKTNPEFVEFVSIPRKLHPVTSRQFATSVCIYRQRTQHANAHLKDNSDLLLSSATPKTSPTLARS